MANLWHIARRAGGKSFTTFRLPTKALPKKVGIRALSTSQALGNIVTSPVPDVDQPPGNLFNTVFENASKWGSKTAVECSRTGRNYTYNQVLDGISKWAGFLTSLGLKKGDVIAINMPNCPEYPIALFGALSIGVVATAINPKYTAEEIVKQLVDSDAQLLVGDPCVEAAILDALAQYKKPLHIIMNGPSKIAGALNFTNILNDAKISYVDAVDVSPKDMALLPYSSGTTGPPKGVELSHGAFSINVRMCMHDHFCFTKEVTDAYQESYVALLPFYHISGVLAQLIAGFVKGAKVITMPVMEPNNFIDTISKNKVEMLHLVPPLLNFLIHSPLATREKLASVNVMPIGAAPVLPSAAAALKDKLQKDIFFQELYGMTEVLLTNIVPTNQERIGTSGKLLPNVSAKIIDTLTGELLPSSSVGEICMKTPAMMTGYHKNDKATANTIDSEGWLHSGDVGYFDEEGYVKIVDRTKELIKVKGLQVSPSELEDIIRQHPHVIEVGVVGVPNDRSGEVPRAYVVTKNQISESEIHSFIETRLAPHKKLVGGVVFVGELPKTSTGKILRRELKKMAQG